MCLCFVCVCVLCFVCLCFACLCFACPTDPPPPRFFLSKSCLYYCYKSGLPADGTMAAAVIYTIGDLHRPGCVIDYPRGGGGEVIAAMVRGEGCGGGSTCVRVCVCVRVFDVCALIVFAIQ